MKKHILQMMLIAILAFGSADQLRAQAQSKGLYLTYSDYLYHKLSYPEDPSNSNRNKIALHEFFGSDKVTVTGDGKKLSFDKNRIFGYHDADGGTNTFPFFAIYEL